MDEFDLHKEPEFSFSPLDEEQYAQLYQIEMDGFDDDLPFYLQEARPNGNTLELGCGTGRLTARLAARGQHMTGLDLSLPMLHRAIGSGPPSIRYLCGDLSSFFFKQQFDTIMIPYHTLNLLPQREQVKRCLKACRQLLQPGGKLLLQLFLPDQALIKTSNTRLFQFQMFNGPDGLKIIKETIRIYLQDKHRLLLEERYRLRSGAHGIIKKEDYSHTLPLLAYDQKTWSRLITDAGFSIQHQFGSYQLDPYIPLKSSSLLLSCLAIL